MARTFLETTHDHLWILQVNLSQKIHVREALDDFALSPLWDGVVVSVHEELERSIRDVFLPLRAAVFFIEGVKLFVCGATGVELVN